MGWTVGITYRNRFTRATEDIETSRLVQFMQCITKLSPYRRVRCLLGIGQLIGVWVCSGCNLYRSSERHERPRLHDNLQTFKVYITI